MTPRLTASLCFVCASSGLGACASSGPTTELPSRPVIAAEVPAARSAHELAASIAAQQIGVRYRFGGTTPTTGFDCSGLVHYSFTQAGLSVPRTSHDQFRASRKIALDQAEPGDIVFFQDQEKLSNVGIYLGDRRFVHAPSSGKAVAISRIDSPYYQEHLVAVGRLN